jgi:hypothetical protein
MASAHYTIYVPAADELGQPLRLHEAVHQHLLNQGGAPVQTHHGMPSHTVSAWAEDSPAWDSVAKQVGTLAAQQANVPVVHVTKEGDKSAAWEMANNGYQQGVGADPSVLTPTLITGIHAALASREP